MASDRTLLRFLGERDPLRNVAVSAADAAAFAKRFDGFGANALVRVGPGQLPQLGDRGGPAISPSVSMASDLHIDVAICRRQLRQQIDNRA